MLGVRKYGISALTPGINNALVIGVIIAKTSTRVYIARQDQGERGVFNLTIRDSPTDTINVTYWGSGNGTKRIEQMFHIGDVVEIMGPKVSFVQMGKPNERYRPSVTSPFELEVQEMLHGSILPHFEPDMQSYEKLTHYITKPPGAYLRLGDLDSYSKTMAGNRINLLVVVATVRATVVKKGPNGDSVRRELAVFDDSKLEFKITIWQEDIISQMDSWKPRQTVLFIADCNVMFDDASKSATVRLGPSTIVTVDPNIAEAEVLRKFAITAPIQPSDLLHQAIGSVTNIGQINTVMSTAQVLNKAYSSDTPGGRFTALVYAHVTKLNLDGTQDIFLYKCVNCGATKEDEYPCVNGECVVINPPHTPVFNITVSLTDHRGTIEKCQLMGEQAVRILKCSETEFQNMSDKLKTELKWRLLLHLCECRIVVLCKNSGRAVPLISLLACEPADTHVVSAKLPIY